MARVALRVADRSLGGRFISDGAFGRRRWNRDRVVCGPGGFLLVAFTSERPAMMYQLGWSTLPGLRGLSCSEFRATPTDSPDRDHGVAVEFFAEAQRDAFLRRLEEHFAR